MPLPDEYDPALDRDLEEKYRVELEESKGARDGADGPDGGARDGR